ncbi:hypothetical protein METH_00900 [Leisingera methylohalidivorans DSM 14336]|uniref:Uncharacterized protein n=1 Tax=Leisingera methylohalidivorans DSM 14336 TaxID=999552 RepID=V9VY12_9RHOB|nr:hypothetical protein METH_00900 [Leisingera methylohalidivorans DSM 14336]
MPARGGVNPAGKFPSGNILAKMMFQIRKRDVGVR